MTKEGATTAQPAPPPTKSSSATATLQADTTITTISNPKRRKSSRTVKNLVKSANVPLKTAKNTISNTISKNTVKVTGKIINKVKTNGKLTLKNSKQNSSKIITKNSTISTPRNSSKSSINAIHNRKTTASLIVNEFLTLNKTKIIKKSSSSRKRKQSNSTSESSLLAVESKQLKRADTPSCSELESDSAFMGNSTSLPNADSRDSESPSFQEIPSSDQENRPRTRSAKVKGTRPSYYETNPPLSARQRAALGINLTKQAQPFNALNTPSPQPSLPQTGTFSVDSPPYQPGSSNLPHSENSVFTSPNTDASIASPDLISANHQTTPSSTINRTSSRFSQLCGFNSPCGNSNRRKNKDVRKSDKIANGKNKNNKNKESQPSSPSVLKTQHSHLLNSSVERPHCIYPDEHFWLPNEEVPSRLEELDRAPIMDHDEALSKAWNDNDSSQNIIVIDNGYTLHRHPVAQSTDAIRAPTKHSLPSKILSDEFCRGELYYRQYYSPMKSIESNTESSTELQEILEQEFMSGSPTLPRSADTPTPELPESENSNTNVKTKKYNLRSRKHREKNVGDDSLKQNDRISVSAKDKIYTLASIKSPTQTENALGNELKNQIDNQGEESIEEHTENISQNSGSKIGRIVKQRGSKKKNKANVSSESVNPIAKKNRTNK